MIDLSILTITHNNTHTTGIDWNQLYSLQNFSTIPQTDSAQNGFMQLSNGEFSYSLNLFPQNITLNRIVEFLSQYGEVSTLSNPKLLTLNNQPAMISVGDVIRYRKNGISKQCKYDNKYQYRHRISFCFCGCFARYYAFHF